MNDWMNEWMNEEISESEIFLVTLNAWSVTLIFIYKISLSTLLLYFQ